MPNIASRPQGSACRCPAGFSMVEAAALPETFFTVWTNLFQRGGAKAGRHGARPWRHQRHRHHRHPARQGVRPRPSSSPPVRPRNAPRALEIGAAHAIDYKAQDFVEEVKRDHRRRRRRGRARHGRRRLCAAQPRLPRRGGPARLDRRPARAERPRSPLWDVMRKRLTLTGSTLRARSGRVQGRARRRAAARGLAAPRGGRIRPVIHSTFPLADAADAHRLMDSGDHVGKIVLEVERWPFPSFPRKRESRFASCARQ